MEPIKPTASSSPANPHPFGAGMYPRSGDYFQSSSSSGTSNATRQTILGISSAAQAANSAGSPWSSSFGSSSFASSSRRRPYSSLSLSELSCSGTSVPSASMSSVTWSSYWSTYRDMVPLGLRGMVVVGIAAVGGSYGGAGIWRQVWRNLKCK
mmetsp:Transcript_3216/g.5623  ORF Transcript_3216/g.5623 Transcript_3216/m.5623 type:complete len:153 (+) Transcript_3216:899-1357(+)